MWNEGYISDIGYTHGFYRELTPSFLELVALSRGLRSPQADDPLAFAELGCGQGFSANLLAAANPHARFHAFDFNPTHVAGAQALAAETGSSNVMFHEHSFAELDGVSDLPDFDVIALHGVWSWISPENRHRIIAFARRRLKPSGLFYISYNALPGWASAMPLRRLLVDAAARASGPLTIRIEQALSAVERFLDTEPMYVRANPGIRERLAKIKEQGRDYLAHEYFNRDWTPLYHADVVAELTDAKLSFVGSASPLEGVDAINLTAEQQARLAEVGEGAQRETLRDFLLNQQFRRDVFIRGAVPMPGTLMNERWLDLRLALSTVRADVPQKVAGMLGEAELQADVYGPLLDGLASGPSTLRQIVADPVVAKLGWPRLMQAVTILIGMGHLQPCLDAKGDATRTASTRAFNAAVLKRARSSADLQFLASPVTGGGVSVDRFQQLFLLARQSNLADAPAFVWHILETSGQRLVKEGLALQTAEENLTELRSRYAMFLEKKLPVLEQLGIA
jgi:SAM-dependent methyltransferase